MVVFNAARPIEANPETRLGWSVTLWILATLGATVGGTTADWQASFTYGTVLGDQIAFPDGDVLQLMISAAPTVTGYIAAALLAWGISPHALNVGLAAGVGALIFIGQGLFLKALGATPLFGLCLALTAHASGALYFNGVNYTIPAPGENAGFAPIVIYAALVGLSWIMLSAARATAAVSAVLPIVHPFCGLWFAGIIFFGGLVAWWRDRDRIVNFLIVATGCGMAGIAFLAFHFLGLPPAPTNVPLTDLNPITFIRLHNGHAAPIALNSSLLVAIFSILVSLYLRSHATNRLMRLGLTILTLNGVFSLILWSIYWLPDAWLHPYMMSPLWNRNLNLNVIALPGMIALALTVLYPGVIGKSLAAGFMLALVATRSPRWSVPPCATATRPEPARPT